MGTLWNAYTSYESSSSFSRTQFCEHFKDPTINTLKSKAKFICQTVGVRNLWEQVLGKETFEVKQCLPHQQCNTVRFPSRRPSQVGDLCFLLFSNFTTFKTKACGKWNCALVWSCHHLAGHTLGLQLPPPCWALWGIEAQPCRLPTGELFRSNKTCQEQIYDCGHRCGTLSL